MALLKTWYSCYSIGTHYTGRTIRKASFTWRFLHWEKWPLFSSSEKMERPFSWAYSVRRYREISWPVVYGMVWYSYTAVDSDRFILKELKMRVFDVSLSHRLCYYFEGCVFLATRQSHVLFVGCCQWSRWHWQRPERFHRTTWELLKDHKSSSICITTQLSQPFLPFN